MQRYTNYQSVGVVLPSSHCVGYFSQSAHQIIYMKVWLMQFRNKEWEQGKDHGNGQGRTHKHVHESRNQGKWDVVTNVSKWDESQGFCGQGEIVNKEFNYSTAETHRSLKSE